MNHFKPPEFTFDFSKYDLIIDARSPREFEEDHIPGAVNLPVANNEEYAEVGTMHRTNKHGAYKIGVQYSLKNIARHLEETVSKYDATSNILVYCFRGGKRSRLWLDALETIGYQVERLPGGWKKYRAYVNEQLAVVPAQFCYNVLSGPTGCGKTRLLYALEACGAQVMDLEDIAMHRGSVIGALPGTPQPTQKLFDSQILQKMKSFSTDRPIWVEAESKKIGNVQLPDALLSTMRMGAIIPVDADMGQRVLLWREDYRHFEEDPQSLVGRLEYLRPLVGGKELDEWRLLADERKMPELFERIMRNHYDPAYARSTQKNYPGIEKLEKVFLTDLSPDGLLPVARSLIARHDAAG